MQRFSRRLAQLAWAFAWAVLASCATTGTVLNASALQTTKRVYAPQSWGRAEEERIADVFAVLRKHGYELTTQLAPGDLALRFRVSGGLTMKAAIELWREQELLLKVESINHGVGTAIARPSARAGRIDAALAELDQQLAALDRRN